MALGTTYDIALAIVTAAAAGLAGAFALMRKTVLAGDVMSHIAIPGLGLAFLWNINPFVGGGLTLLAGTLLIWRIQKKTELSAEAAIGVIFATSVALGALLIHSTEDLVEALFGGFGSLTMPTFLFGVGASVLVIAVLWSLRRRLIIALFSSELAASMGVDISRMNLAFLLAFALAILTSLRPLGGLLAGALIIIPASTARQLTHSLTAFLGMSMLIAVTSILAGYYLSIRFGIEMGPATVIIASSCFVLSLLKPHR
jgi:ABC-type Mn2+/Zn2+ transport system permease subunit